MAFVAKCTKCGKLDQRKSYSSADDAAKQGAFTKWTCPTCAWTEFELDRRGGGAHRGHSGQRLTRSAADDDRRPHRRGRRSFCVARPQAP